MFMHPGNKWAKIGPGYSSSKEQTTLYFVAYNFPGSGYFCVFTENGTYETEHISIENNGLLQVFMFSQVYYTLMNLWTYLSFLHLV